MKFIESKKIKTFFIDYMESLNITNKISKVVSEALIEASLLGIDSHGVNLFGHYMDCVKHGRINPSGKIEIAKRELTLFVTLIIIFLTMELEKP